MEEERRKPGKELGEETKKKTTKEMVKVNLVTGPKWLEKKLSDYFYKYKCTVIICVNFLLIKLFDKYPTTEEVLYNGENMSSLSFNRAMQRKHCLSNQMGTVGLVGSCAANQWRAR